MSRPLPLAETARLVCPDCNCAEPPEAEVLIPSAAPTAADPLAAAATGSVAVDEEAANSVNVGEEWLTRDPPQPDFILDSFFESGDVVLVTAPSKCRKSFFVLQLAFCIAAGKPFIGTNVKSPRRVLLLNLENDKNWQWRRARNMAKALGIFPEALAGRLICENLRGREIGIDRMRELCQRSRPGCLVVDPIYKLSGAADELDQKSRAELMGDIQKLASECSVAVILVHHDAKGYAGDRDTRDRGSGSNIVNRAVDCTFSLTQWGGADEDADALAVLETLPRNAPSPDATTIRFDGGTFVPDDRPPMKKTARTARASGGRKQDGDPAVDGKTLGKDLASGKKVFNMTEARNKAELLFGKKRGERALAFVKVNPSKCGVSYAMNESNRYGKLGESKTIAEFVAQNPKFSITAETVGTL